MMLVNARGQEGEGSERRAKEGSGVLVVILPSVSFSQPFVMRRWIL